MKSDRSLRFSLAFGFVASLVLIAGACSAPTLPAATLGPTPTIALTPPTSPATQVSPTGSIPVAVDLDAFFDRFQKTTPFSGIVLIAQNDRILYEKSFGETRSTPPAPLSATTKFRIASVSKQFTAAAILKLQADGKLNVHDPVCKYLKSCPKGWDQITIHHLLTHTSGIAEDYGSAVENKDPEFDNKPHTPEELVARYGEITLKFKPGSAFSYGNGGYITLAAIIEQVSGEDYETFLRKSILDPLNMKDTGITIEDGQLAGEPLGFELSNGVGAGTLYSTVQDLYRWTQQLDSWERDPQSAYLEMFQPHTVADTPGSMYGYGLRIEKLADQPRIGHGGLASGSGDAGYGALVERYPNNGLTIIILSNRPYPPDDLGPVLAKITLGIK